MMRASIHSRTAVSQGTVGTCLLIAAWVFANSSSLTWLFDSFRQALRLNVAFIGLMVALLVVQVVRVRRRAGVETHSFSVSATPTLRSLPLALMVGSALGAIALQWLLDIQQLTVVLFLLSTYGLCGLFLTPSVWRKGLPFASLVACIVPFSSQVSLGLGFPARIITAHAVEQILSALHVAAISSYDIIVLENGVAHVDIPCSGLKSLWTGTIFLLAATWLEGRKLGARWLVVCFSNLFFLTSANVVRVLVLVVVTYAWKQPQYAQILHLPLGLIGLVCACALSWLMLQTVPKQGGQGDKGTRRQGEQGTDAIQTSSLSSPASPAPSASLTAQAVLIAFVVSLGLISQLYQPAKEQPQSIASLRWPQQMVSEPIPLTAAEHRFFDNYSYLLPEKRRFVSGDLSGSILVVANTTWRTYHPPELCLLGSGLKVDRIERKRVTPDVQARWLSLQDGKLSATYWFQSPKQTTDEFLSRLWSDVTRRQKNWVLISVLFDRSLSPESTEIQTFATTIHDAIDHSLGGVEG